MSYPFGKYYLSINFKKVLITVLMLVMILSLTSLTVSAADNNSYITNNNTFDSNNISHINVNNLTTGNQDIVQNVNNVSSVSLNKTENNVKTGSNNINKSDKKDVLLISDNGGTNIFDSAALKILENTSYPNLNIQIRSGNQISKMDETDLYNLVNSSDIVIVNWLATDADSVLTNLLNNWPELTNKELFLFLETSSSSGATNYNLVKKSTINYTKVFSNRTLYTDNYLKEYFDKTKRGKDYEDVYEYLTKGNGNKVNKIFNQFVLYKDCNDIDNQLNEILFALNITGYKCSYLPPTYHKSYAYGLYREKYMSLEEYMKEYFNSSRKYTIGLLESNMYVSSNELQPYYALIKYLEEKGCNVIPVVAAGGSENQLKVMVEYFTNAPNYNAYLSNSSKYRKYVDAIISMPAYGIGGTLFDNATSYFEKLNVPVFRAVHSDYISNEQWELSTTGLPGNRSDKWWHVAIGEAQGIIDATFVGGVTHEISPMTGAQVTGYKPNERNIDLFTDRIISWVKLQYTLNNDKLISLVYYNYPPGKQNIGSSYLNTITSIYNLLTVLKKEGYNVGKLPSNASELEDMMIQCGINVASWAPGEVEKLANRSNVVLLPVSEYLNWFNKLDNISKIQVVEGPVAYIAELCRRSIEINYTSPMEERLKDWYSGVTALLPDNYTSVATPILDNIVESLKKYLGTGLESDYNIFLEYKKQWDSLKVPGLHGWGEAPGNIMTVNRNGTDYFVIPGLKFGNIFVAPEPQRGWENNSDTLYHSTAVAPTHQYLAAFYYMQTYYSSAQVFVGRHATHEWLPGKEVLLSTTDYGSIVLGSVPQIYFYISDGLGEGLQAKRRGFAVIISHLTSPLAYTQLYGNLTVLANLTYLYENTFDQNTKDALASQIRSIVKLNDYVRAMGLSDAEFNNLSSDELVSQVDEYIYSIQNTLYTYGLHAIGENWTDLDIGLAVSAALASNFTYNGITTNLYDELSKFMFNKKYNQLNAFERNEIINNSAKIVMALIYSNSTDVAKVIGANSTSLITAFDYARYYMGLIYYSINNEVTSFVEALNGEYINPGASGDVLDKNSLPTGVNFFHDQSQELPSKEAYDYARTLTLLSLSTLTDDIEKLVMGIWCVETARDNGSLVSVVLYLLGMEPIYTSSPSAGGKDDDGVRTGTKVKIMPKYVRLEDLVRPDGWKHKRIDVTIITSGNFRDLYSTQISLLDNAFRIALARSYITILQNKTLMNSKWGKDIKEGLDKIVGSVGYYGVGKESLEDNYVAKHWVTDFIYYKELGYNTTYAAECAITRIFAPPVGDYGAGIAKSVSLSWTWNNTDELAKFYLGRMGNMYSKDYWGETNPIVFLRALNNTGDLIVSRNTKVYGVLDNDDFFDYWGGLSMTMAYVNGKTPKMNVLMYADRNNPYIASLEKVLAKETVTRYFNPTWISGMMNEGYSGARYISNKFLTDLLGWSVTRPSAVSNEMWDNAYNTYINDKYGLGVKNWLRTGNNNYAFISSTGTMLTAAYNGYWKTDSATIKNIANQWADAIIQNGVACCDCSCGNVAMMQWAMKFVNPDLLTKLSDQFYKATNLDVFNPVNYEKSHNTQKTNASGSSNPSGSSSQSTGSSSSGSTNGQGGSVGDTSASASSSQSSSSSAKSEEDSSSESAGDSGKSYEISKVDSSSSSTTTEKSMSLPAIICVLVLLAFFAVGYRRNKKNSR